ncbi:hypothetical protein AVEN_160541-1 [Araneus ventricosus]|uniref:Uncharacterized protein n=1 Tax=Araneus ventricosus TaxID=182803 RepID=A0A4Y2PF12_ARAVE|nr:hypothetical protein AVEN_160541-1 [Araneus ventricosus]
MDAFPTETSQRLVAVPQKNGKWDAFETLMDQGRVQAFMPYMDLATKRIFHHLVRNGLQILFTGTISSVACWSLPRFHFLRPVGSILKKFAKN